MTNDNDATTDRVLHVHTTDHSMDRPDSIELGPAGLRTKVYVNLLNKDEARRLVVEAVNLLAYTRDALETAGMPSGKDRKGAAL